LLELGLHLACERHPSPHARQQPLHAIDDACPVPLRRQEFPMQLPTVFINLAGHTHHTPHLRLSRDVAEQHRQQFMDIEALRLRPAVPPIHLNARRIDYMVLHALGA
jgi:hypothetical protein